MTDTQLMALAVQARDRAYTPYSGFRVGAALLTTSGRVFLGCNIENAAYSPSICAERTAIFKAVSEGETSFEKMAVVGGKEELLECCTPCGVCRQVMTEFCSEDFPLLLGRPEAFQTYTLSQILPYSFTKKDL